MCSESDFQCKVLLLDSWHALLFKLKRYSNEPLLLCCGLYKPLQRILIKLGLKPVVKLFTLVHLGFLLFDHFINAFD